MGKTKPLKTEYKAIQSAFLFLKVAGKFSVFVFKFSVLIVQNLYCNKQKT